MELVPRLRARLADLLARDPLLARLLPLDDYLGSAKFNRAQLLTRVASENGVNAETAFEAALGIEILHLATLAHDDVLDDSDLRRRQDSLRRRAGDRVAILFGDVLFALAMEQIQRTQSRECTRLFIDCVKTTCRGETLQDLYLTRSPGDDLGLESVLDVARGKTGALFAFCTEAPFWMDVEVPHEVRRAMGGIGLESGLAYQIADDVLDIMGESGNLGKPACNDLIKNCLTAPLFLLMGELRMSFEELRSAYLSRTQELRSTFLASHSLARVKELMGQTRHDIEAKLEILDRHGVVMRDTCNRFWGKFVAGRIESFRDCLAQV